MVGVDGVGVPVGYVQSALDATDRAFLAEIGVVESQRGHRHVDELLAYGTRVLAEHGETRIRSYTDAANPAMRAAFACGGYAETGSRRDFRRRVPHRPLSEDRFGLSLGSSAGGAPWSAYSSSIDRMV